MSLYREFRPRALSEMTGQSSIIKTIKNQIETQNISHAYLFSGPRGIGKTSIAKILSRAVNCERYDEFLAGKYQGEIPCNQCQTCKDILQDMSMDVIEMDAASNNGVDDIRAINDMVKFPPASARYKVIIIDEVHMLSKSAFNALLKTLEEPPSYIIFILATTEVNRIPATVLSRCQRYDFKKMTQDELVERLAHVCESLGRQYDPQALRLIASRSEGAMRDALSLLDQCLSYSEDLSEKSVLYSLSLVSEAFLLELFEALNDSALSKILTLLRSANANGFDPKLLLDDLAQFLHRLIRYCIEKKSDQFHPDTMAYLDAHQSQLCVKKLIYFQQKLLFSSSEIKFSSNLWIAIECLFLDMASFLYEGDVRALEVRVEELEHKITMLKESSEAPASSQNERLASREERLISREEGLTSREERTILQAENARRQDAPSFSQNVNGHSQENTKIAVTQAVTQAVMQEEPANVEAIPGASPKYSEQEILKLLLDGIPRKLPHLYLPIKQSSIALQGDVLWIGIASEYDFMVPTLNTGINISEILKLLKGSGISDVKFDYKKNIASVNPSLTSPSLTAGLSTGATSSEERLSKEDMTSEEGIFEKEIPEKEISEKESSEKERRRAQVDDFFKQILEE